MTVLNEAEWASLSALERGIVPSDEIAQRLKEIQYVIVTQRGELRVTGLGHDAMTLRKYGIKPPIAAAEDDLSTDESSDVDSPEEDDKDLQSLTNKSDDLDGLPPP